MNRRFGAGRSLELTLLRIVAGYRAFGAAWLLLLAALVVGSRELPPGRPAVIWTIAGIIVVWTLLAIWIAYRRPQLYRNWWYIAGDVGLAVVSVLAADWADSTAIAGGYPLAAVFSAIYGRGTAGGVASATALTVTSVVRLPLISSALAAQVGFVISYLFSAAAATVFAAVIRREDRDRIQVEQDLADAEADRARAEERAGVASHLHDSVLQTLALIQRDPSGSDSVRSLARRQERELRAWLFGADADVEGTSFRSSIEDMCAEVEDLTGVRIESVIVGDRTVDGDLAALVQAAREATINAAKHAGVDEVSVYSEIGRDDVAIFVRDRGVGFDPDSVESSRRGITESIVARVERHGGTAEIDSIPDRGTEVRLRLPAGEPA